MLWVWSQAFPSLLFRGVGDDNVLHLLQSLGFASCTRLLVHVFWPLLARPCENMSKHLEKPQSSGVGAAGGLWPFPGKGLGQGRLRRQTNEDWISICKTRGGVKGLEANKAGSPRMAGEGGLKLVTSGTPWTAWWDNLHLQVRTSRVGSP